MPYSGCFLVSYFQISLVQGLNRQIRRMCEYFDYEVVKLERIQIMNIKLGNLGQGNYRDLTQGELEELFDLLDKSKDIVQAKKPANSNKAINRALQGYDIKTNYRKANIVSKQAQKAKADKPFNASTEVIDREQVKQETTMRKKKKKGGSGLRVGKSRVVEKKTQPPKQNSPIRKGRKV